jgi:hypothetical protein
MAELLLYGGSEAIMRRCLAYVGTFLLPLVVALAGCEHSSPTSPTPEQPCTYALSASSLAFTASGGTQSITVTTPSSCSWTASSNREWIIIPFSTAVIGTAAVVVRVTENPTPDERTGTLTVAGQAVAVRQDGLVLEPCTIEIAPAAATYGADVASGSFAVSAPGHCSWTAAAQAPWLAVTNGGQGAGNGTVSYAVERNRTTTNRTGTIAVSDRIFTVTQGGDAGLCDYSVTPVEFTPCMSAPFDLIATVTTQPGCTWTAATETPWIALTGGHAGEGTGTVTFRVGDNWDAPRQGVVMVRWPTVTAGQNLRVLQAGCLYSVTQDAFSIAATGGSGRFEVYQMAQPETCGGPLQNACVWSATSDVPWITITTPMPQRGDNPVSFTVAANESTSARTGTITVRDKVVRVTQAGR